MAVKPTTQRLLRHRASQPQGPMASNCQRT